MNNTPVETFDPDAALIRYRELEALLNLELLTRDDWQRCREQGDYRWLHLSKHFQAQEALLREAWEHKYHIYSIVDDDVTPIYAIAKIPEGDDEFLEENDDLLTDFQVRSLLMGYCPTWLKD